MTLVDSPNQERTVGSPLAPNPTCLLSRFHDIKVHQIDPHPVKPWILFANKRGHVYLYDYEQNDVLHSFSLNSVYESKREEAQLFKVLEKNYNNVSVPDWYDDQLLQLQKLGDLKSVRLYDDDIIHWKLNEKELDQHAQITNKHQQQQQQQHSMRPFERSMSRRSMYLTSSVESPTMGGGTPVTTPTTASASGSGFNSSGSSGSSNGLNGKSLNRPYTPSTRPKCIVLHTESRVIMLRYDEVSSSVYFFDEVKNSQLDRNSILSIEFLYSHPIIALGLSDGTIRLWNYKTREMMKKIIVTTGKVSKMIAIHKEGGLNTYPSLLCSHDNGTMSMWNIDTGKAEYSVPKGQGTINDMMIDWDKGHVITICSDKSIFIRKLNTGELITSTKFMAKNVMQSISKVTACNCLPSWFLMISEGNRKLYQIGSDLNEQTYSNAFDVIQFAPKRKQSRKDKIYTLVHHQLHPSVFFIGTSFGIMSFKMDYNRRPAVVVGITRDSASLESASSPSSFSIPTPTLSLPPLKVGQSQTQTLANQRVVYYVKHQAIFQRSVITMDNKEGYGDPVKVLSLPKIGNVKLAISYSGHYFSILWEKEQDYEIYNTMTWKRQASGNNTHCLVWSTNDDRYAILRGSSNSKHITIYSIVNNSTQVVVERANTASTAIRALFGGVLLGVAYEDKSGDAGFHFLEWTGQASRGGYLPQPKMVRWDPLSSKCAMFYDDSYSVFTYFPEFRMECYVKEKVEAAKWWNSVLFLATNSEIKCLFTTRKQLYTVVLASFDIAQYGTMPLGNDEDSLDPIPQPRPKGNLSFVDVVGDALYVIDTNYTLHSMSLDTPSLKFRILVASGVIDKALSWIPYIPQELHDYCADFLVAHYFPDYACQIETMTPSKRFQLCIEYGLIENGFDALSQIDADKPVHELTHKELAKLYIRLASIGELQIDNLSAMGELNEIQQRRIDEMIETLEKSYKRATELDPSLFVQLIVFYTKHGETDKLQNLKHVILEKKHQSTQAAGGAVIDWDNVLTMLGLFTKDYNFMSQYLPRRTNSN